MISLREIDSANYHECISLSVAPDQQHFVASNVQSLADAFVYPDAEPYALYDDADEMVGFALLLPLPEGGPADSVPPDATLVGYVLVRLMIDARFQGRGYGRAAVDAIVEQVRQRGLQTIRLSVVPENEQALALYERNGFVRTGEREGPEIVLERSVS